MGSRSPRPAARKAHLEPVKLVFGDVVAETGQPVHKVYFPFIGVVSLVVAMKDGDMIETAMVGRDGMVNGTSALDGNMSLHKEIVQVACAGATIKPDALRSLATEFQPLHSLLIRHEQVLSLRPSNRLAAMAAIRSKLACADGFCGCVTWRNPMN